MSPVVLASSSPRRRELLQQVGIPFTVDTSYVDETMPEGTAPEDFVKELSKRKAEAVSPRHPDSIVIGADTIVALEDKILGKPKDQTAAYEMLCMLSGKVHSVYTGVTIIYPPRKGPRHTDTFSVRTDVKMYDSDKRILRDYADCGEPLDKAGAYGIQGRGAVLVERINGDYCNVKGLPVSEVFKRLYPFISPALLSN